MQLQTALEHNQGLLANLLQSSSSTFSCVSFPSFLPSKKACWTHKFRHLGVGQQYVMSQGSPPRMKIAGLFPAESLMNLAFITTYENTAIFRGVSARYWYTREMRQI
jgi:hypothetical protein